MSPGRLRHILFRLTIGIPAVAAASVVIIFLHDLMGAGGAVLIYLAAVLWSAARYGRLAALSTIVTAALAGNYFYFEPQFAFGIGTTEDALILAVFLLVAVSTGTLAARLREQMENHRHQAVIARERSAELEFLLNLQQTIHESTGREEMLARIEKILAPGLAPSAQIYMADDGKSAMGRAARSVFPLLAHDKVVGSLVMATEEVGDRQRLILAVANLIGLAIERMEFQSRMEDARIQAETEKLRAALLSSVSHDFRTPLGSIIGAASTMDMPGGQLTEERRRQMVATILQAARRLDRYVINILDLTSIHAGVVRPAMDWCDLEDVIGSALSAMESRLAEFEVAARIEPGLPLLWLDHVLMERVLVNLLENAVKFSGAGNRIEITASTHSGRIEIIVFNTGSDVADGDLPHLFDRFHRGGSEVTGTGLGLAICKGFMNAHGGDIIAERIPARNGVAFHLRLPLPQASAAPSMEGRQE